MLTQDKKAEQIASGDTLCRFDQDVWLKHDRYRRENLRAAKLLNERGKTILDFGCGPGIFSAILARKNTVFGFDIATQAVRSAVVRAKKENLEFSGAIMDGELLGLAPEKFDIELVAWALHHFADPKIPLRQLFEPLKSEGSLIIIEPNETAFPQRLSRAVEDKMRNTILEAGLDTPNRITHGRHEYVRALKSSGFDIVKIFNHHNGERPEIPNDVKGARRLMLRLLIYGRYLVFTVGSWFGSGEELFIIAKKPQKLGVE